MTNNFDTFIHLTVNFITAYCKSQVFLVMGVKTVRHDPCPKDHCELSKPIRRLDVPFDNLNGHIIQFGLGTRQQLAKQIFD